MESWLKLEVSSPINLQTFNLNTQRQRVIASSYLNVSLVFIVNIGSHFCVGILPNWKPHIPWTIIVLEWLVMVLVSLINKATRVKADSNMCIDHVFVINNVNIKYES